MSLQVVQPRMRGFISLSAHPEGCAVHVRTQVAAARSGGPGSGLGTVLVVGSSTGYGLASLLCAVFGHGAPALGVCLERPSSEERGGSAGWYNLAEAHRLAAVESRQLETLNADAFAPATNEQAVAALRARFGPVSLLVYSLAAPRRDGPDGARWESVLKPIGAPYEGKSIDLRSGEVATAAIEPATEAEIAATVKVMGGEDWAGWVEALQAADLLAPGFRTVAYSYLGPEVTRRVYRDGTIGRAKQDLEATAGRLRERLAALDVAVAGGEVAGGGAWVSVNKAVVTQASAAIPGVPLYMSLLFREMKRRGTHEGPIEQVVRLFRDHLAAPDGPRTDEAGLIRHDEYELDPAVQAAVGAAWAEVTTANLAELADYAGYRRYFEELFGFGGPGVDYAAPTELHRELVPAPGPAPAR